MTIKQQDFGMLIQSLFPTQFKAEPTENTNWADFISKDELDGQ
jgi:hypothetical protein